MKDSDVRGIVRFRDKFRCTSCGMTDEEHRQQCKGKSLHVHREDPKLGYTVENCRTICYRCHGKIPHVGGNHNPRCVPITPFRFGEPHLTMLQQLAERFGTSRSQVVRIALDRAYRAHFGEDYDGQGVQRQTGGHKGGPP